MKVVPDEKFPGDVNILMYNKCRSKFYETRDEWRQDTYRHATLCIPPDVKMMDNWDLPLYGNLSALTKENDAYRKVIATTPYQQLVLMSLDDVVGREVDWEMHPFTTQFIRVEKGTLTVKIRLPNDKEKTITLSDDGFVIIPPNMWHYIGNKSKEGEWNPVKLYTIYSPPEHPVGTLELSKPEKREK